MITCLAQAYKPDQDLFALHRPRDDVASISSPPPSGSKKRRQAMTNRTPEKSTNEPFITNGVHPSEEVTLLPELQANLFCIQVTPSEFLQAP